jgi:hypothetical protein
MTDRQPCRPGHPWPERIGQNASPSDAFLADDRPRLPNPSRKVAGSNHVGKLEQPARADRVIAALSGQQDTKPTILRRLIDRGPPDIVADMSEGLLRKSQPFLEQREGIRACRANDLMPDIGVEAGGQGGIATFIVDPAPGRSEVEPRSRGGGIAEDRQLPARRLTGLGCRHDAAVET